MRLLLPRLSRGHLSRLPFHKLALPLPSPFALLLYALTFSLEVPVMFVRALIVLASVTLLLLLFGHSTAAAYALANLALLPTLWSVIALVTAIGGGWWWKQSCGGRRPSERERLAYEDAIELLQALSGEALEVPRSWFVLDVPQPDAGVCGDALLLSRGLFESEQLPAVLAHELGHLRSGDGRVTAALNRLVINPLPRRKGEEPLETRSQNDAPGSLVIEHRIVLAIFGLRAIGWLVRKVVALARGGAGLRLSGPCGLPTGASASTAPMPTRRASVRGDELADFLEIHALIHDHPVPFIWLTEHTHPPTELRVERLRAAALGDVSGGVAHPSLAELSDPVKGAPAGPPAAGLRPPLTGPASPALERSGRQGGPCRPSIDER